MNLLQLGFSFSGIGFSICGLLIILVEKHLSTFLLKICRYGKFGINGGHTFLDRTEIQKRCFQHFYTFSGFLSTFCLGLLVYRYFYNKELPEFIVKIINDLLGTPLLDVVPPENAILAMTVMAIHCWKRFYESHYISVFSDGKMNFLLYFAGYFHYTGVMSSIVGEAKQLLTDKRVVLNWTRLTYLDILFSIIFLTSTYMQYRSNVILANLRKDKKGNVVTKKYKIPRGGLFDYVTAPLQLTEIILYLSISVILRSSTTFHFITIWVAINQVICAYLSHKWSVKTFESYPKSRKVLIPFVF